MAQRSFHISGWPRVPHIQLSAFIIHFKSTLPSHFQTILPQNSDSGRIAPDFRGEVIGLLGHSNSVPLTLTQTFLMSSPQRWEIIKARLCFPRKINVLLLKISTQVKKKWIWIELNWNLYFDHETAVKSERQKKTKKNAFIIINMLKKE